MSQHIPAFVVVIPLLGGLIASLLGPGKRSWIWASLCSGGILLSTVELLKQVMAAPDRVIRYAMGDWSAPWGIELVVDPLGAAVLLVVASVGFVVTLYSGPSVRAEIPADRIHHFYALWLLSIAGLLGMTITGDAFNVYVLLEISSLTIYGLIALGKFQNRRALTATMNYVVQGSIGASFILIGIGYLYMMTGTLNMADMAERLRDIQGSTTVQVAFAFLIVGFSIKMALFPLHLWLPNGYAYAPSAVTALLAATATKVGIYLAIRFFYGVFGTGYSFDNLPAETVLLACGCLAIVMGSSAIRQTHVKKVLAYSSVAQIGYIVVGFSLISESGLTGAVIHIGNHALIKGGLFMAVGAMALRVDVSRVSELAGLGRAMPLTSAAFVAGGLGLIGVPLTAGFVSKWYLVTAALEKDGFWPVAVTILVGSILALYYVWRLVEILYFKEPETARTPREAPWSMILCTWILIGASLYFGIDATFTADLARAAATTLLGG